MNIGNKIKDLRIDKKITQEELATNLNVSSKAISRWENGTTYPDISLLPTIAYYFNITTDELLGIDLYKKDEEIKIILDKAKELQHTGDMLKLIELLKNSIKKYPNNFVLLKKLCNALLMSYSSSHKNTDALLECIQIGEKILVECRDQEIRYDIINTLCFAYDANNQKEKALELIEALPSIYSSKEYRRSWLIKGEEHTLEHQGNLMRYLGLIDTEIHNMFTDDCAYNIKLLKKLIDIINVFYEKKDYGFEHWNLMNLNILISKNYSKLKDYENVNKYFKIAINHAKEYDNLKGVFKYKSLLFNKQDFSKDEVQTNSTKTIKEVLQDWLNAKSFTEYKKSNEYKIIEEELKNFS